MRLNQNLYQNWDYPSVQQKAIYEPARAPQAQRDQRVPQSIQHPKSAANTSIEEADRQLAMELQRKFDEQLAQRIAY